MSAENSPLGALPASTPASGSVPAETARASTTRRARRSWTPWEDQALRSRVAQFGDARGSQGRWKEIALGIPGRTAKDCRKRWFHSLDPSLRKGRWTEEEDKVLLDAYSRLGPAWNEIANLIPGRKDDQCSKRYTAILGPLAQNRLFEWTPEEDQILREGVRDLGHRWSAVAARLPGRPPLTCRNRWRNLSKQKSTPPETAEMQQEPSTNADAFPESEAGCQSASSIMSGHDDGPDTPFNLQDAAAIDDHDMIDPLLDMTDTAPDPTVMHHQHGGTSFYHPINGGAPDHSAQLEHHDSALGFGDLGDTSWAPQDPSHQWTLDSSFQGSYPNLGPNRQSLESPAAGPQTSAHASLDTHLQPDLRSKADSLDYRAIELSAEMVSGSSQASGDPPPAARNGASAIGSGTASGVGGRLIGPQSIQHNHNSQPSQNGQHVQHSQQQVVHHHHHHHHYHHHYHHHDHSHRHSAG